MKGIIDRFEGNFVVVEIDGQTKDVPRNEVDTKAKEGDAVKLIDGKWQLDPIDTKKRSDKIKKLMDNVWED